MNITFLGTGTSQGVPVIGCSCGVCKSLDFRDKRTRTSVFIEEDGINIVIDTGPDFRQQMLRERIVQIDAVLFTHEHKDHTAGLDEIRSFNFKQDMEIPIYAREKVIKQLKREFTYIFDEFKYPGIPRVEVKYIENKPFSIQGLRIVPIEVLHHKLPVFGFRIGNFSYITDANRIPEKEFQKIKDSKILVLNALQKEQHLSHFNLNEALDVINRISPNKAYLTHISHKLGLHGDIQLPENVEIAYDGLKVEG